MAASDPRFARTWLLGAGLALVAFALVGWGSWRWLPDWCPQWVARHSPWVEPFARAVIAGADQSLFYRRIDELGQHAIPGLTAGMRNDDLRVRSLCARALINIGVASLPALQQGLQSRHADVRQDSLEGIAAIDPDTARDPARRALSDPHEAVRSAALRILSDDPLAPRAAIVSTLTDPIEGVRVAALDAVIELGIQEAFPAVVSGLDDASAWVRHDAAFALGKLGGERAVEPLCRALSDPDAKVRIAVAEQLGALGRPAALPALVTAAHDGEETVRNAAIAALAGLGGGAFDALSALLNEDSSSRAGAAEALGAIVDPRAVPLLLPLLEDRNPRVRMAAIGALWRLPLDARQADEVERAAERAAINHEYFEPKPLD
jgi:HEAT repeat protein